MRVDQADTDAAGCRQAEVGCGRVRQGAEVLADLREDLRAMGFVIEMDGPVKALVRGIPPTLETGEAREYLKDALAEKARGLDDLWTMMACKTAIPPRWNNATSMRRSAGTRSMSGAPRMPGKRISR